MLHKFHRQAGHYHSLLSVHILHMDAFIDAFMQCQLVGALIHRSLLDGEKTRELVLKASYTNGPVVLLMIPTIVTC